MKKILFFGLAIIAGLYHFPSIAAPQSFEKAKIELRRAVYFDRNDDGELYCGCTWQWMGRSGGRVDLAACGYEVRADRNRARRIEWEHVVPAWVLGHQRQCWQNGGRENCKSTDPIFRTMEADMHNLSPSIGEVNGDRSNFQFGVLPSARPQYGACQTKTDFKQRITEPRNEVKGQVARVYFYMHDRYRLSMSRQQQQLLMAWNKMYPVSDWERERDRRIARSMGHHNPFVTGERSWTLGYRSVGDGLSAGRSAGAQYVTPQPRPTTQPVDAAAGPVIGNRNSKVYHLPAGCPSYNQVSEKNRVPFASEAEAEAAGYRRAGNCR